MIVLLTQRGEHCVLTNSEMNLSAKGRDRHKRFYPYRPIRYHASDIKELSPYVTFKDPVEKICSSQIMNFSRHGLRFCSDPKVVRLSIGDILEDFGVIFLNQCFFRARVQIKHYQAISDRRVEYGVRFLDDVLDIDKVFYLREQSNLFIKEELVKQDKNKFSIYRSHRYEQTALELFHIEANIEFHGKLLPVEIQNFSEFGFKITLVKNFLDSSTILVGDLLLFRVNLDGERFFSGTVRVVHISEHENSYQYGVSCLDRAVKVQLVHTLSKNKELEQDFSLFLAEESLSKDIRAEFKMALNDFRYFLEKMKFYLDRMNEKIQCVPEREEREWLENKVLLSSKDVLEARSQTLMLAIHASIQDLTNEEELLHRRHFQFQLLSLTNSSILAKRALEKPLGYAGDYEMMNIFYCKNFEGNTLWEKLINNCVVNIPPGKAVQNRAAYFRDKIEKTIARCEKKESINIMSFACGPCQELQLYLAQGMSEGLRARDKKVEFYLFDQDANALQYSLNKLYKLKQESCSSAKFIFLNQAIKDVLKEPKFLDAYPKMDLIYAAGLFDYLPDSIAKKLIAVFTNMLSIGGRLIIGNFSIQNKFRFFVEYAGEWFLIHRSQEDLMNLLPNREGYQEAFVEDEASRVNLFLNIHR